MIWEVVYDYDGSESDLSTATGKVQFGTGINASLFSLYSGFATNQNGDKSPTVTAMVNDTRQDQLRIVPLPSAAALAGIGLAGLGSRRRRG